ncbi:phage protein [Wolbachia endosymbiont of Cylisticus convexus]|nr:IS110-like element ISWpi13 family transposase [Wolbachia endosymbiont of Cylisticus convexus]RDD33947.1 Transposase [Wolbachia endosymbiont of Cylisticus convexus]RDD34169.1 S110-like element ISWpi13 family transposase [Wolbachia endosymbiont of Cylisticus convexus]RDD34871.1 phage protein [Wolbachia endosymbiont of Cylisticus convexus]
MCKIVNGFNNYTVTGYSKGHLGQMCVLRSYVRQRKNLIENASTHTLRMQKALTQMNIQLHRVISDTTGVTGMQIIKAIIDGESNPEKLAELRDG